MPVYFVQAGDGGAIKIGFATNPAKRVAALQTAAPVRLRPLGMIEGGIERERELHAQFAPDRRVGEWFNPCPLLLDVIAASAPLIASREPPPISEQWEFIEKAALDIGVEAEAFRKWRVRGVPHQWRLPIVDTALRQGFILDRDEFDTPPGPKRGSPANGPEPNEAAA